MLYLNTKQVFISRLHSDTVDRNDIFPYFGFLFFLNLTLYLISWMLLLNHIIIYLQFFLLYQGSPGPILSRKHPKLSKGCFAGKFGPENPWLTTNFNFS